MKVKAANGFARALKAEGIPWVSCYPTNHVNNALGEEGVPILMMGEERFAVAVADAYSRVTCGKQIGVCTIMANLNAAGIQMAYGAIGQAWEDSSPLLVITEGVGQGAARHTHYDMAEALKSVTKWVGKVDRAEGRSPHRRQVVSGLAEPVHRDVHGPSRRATCARSGWCLRTTPTARHRSKPAAACRNASVGACDSDRLRWVLDERENRL